MFPNGDMRNTACSILLHICRWPDAWHLSSSSTNLTMGISSAWASGASGRGVNVVHVDDGLDYTHKDLRGNYRRALSYDIANRFH